MRINHVSRRAWLRGAGGALLAVPYLSSLVPQRARAQAGDAPLRFVFVGGTLGRDIDRWYPVNDPASQQDGVYYAPLSSLGSTISPILGAAFSAIRNKLSVVRGLDGMQIAGDGHSATHALTGSGLVNGQLGFGYSVDTVLGESRLIYPEKPYVDVLRSQVGPAAASVPFSYATTSGLTRPLPADSDPFTMYSRLFEPATLAARSRFATRQQPVANAVIEDLRRLLSSGRISKDDRNKLDAHLSLLSDVERALGVSVPACGSVQAPAVATSSENLHDAAIKLEIAALSCGLTRVVTHVILQHDSEIVPNTPEAHSAAHAGRSKPAESGREAVDQWVLNQWSMARVASYIEQLDSIPDGDGTLLDHTLFLYSNVESRGFHSFYDMPVIVAGAPSKVRLGQYVDFRPRPLVAVQAGRNMYVGRPYNLLLTSIFNAFGLAPADYERLGVRGFGVYDQFDTTRFSDHYAPFLKDRHASLPYLFRA